MNEPGFKPFNKVHYDSHFWVRCWKSTADIFQLFGFYGNWSCDKI